MKFYVLYGMFFIVMLSGCSFLYHENSWNGRPLSYDKHPESCIGTIPVVVHWGAGWHTSIVIPNQGIKVGQYFKKFPFIEVNWGDKGFYQAGASQWKQLMAATKAMLIPSSSIMYFVGIPVKRKEWCEKYDGSIELSESDLLLLSTTAKKKSQPAINVCTKINHDYELLFRHYDALQIWVTPKDFSALTKKINDMIKVNSKDNPFDLGNGYLFDSGYSTAGRFFASDAYYYGLFHTCNTWTAEVLGEIESIKLIKNIGVYRAESIFEFLHKQIQEGNSCVKAF